MANNPYLYICQFAEEWGGPCRELEAGLIKCQECVWRLSEAEAAKLKAMGEKKGA